ncbi:MAG: FAD:protein FMN transferase, partial [Planctomycetota bacterium]
MKPRTVGWLIVVVLLALAAVVRFAPPGDDSSGPPPGAGDRGLGDPSATAGLEMYPPAAPIGIMNTTAELRAVLPKGEKEAAQQAYRLAEQALRNVEARCSAHLDGSDVWAINEAPAGQVVQISPLTRAVLAVSAQMAIDSAGTFDVTCTPLFRLWSAAGRARQLPTDADIESARAKCGWGYIELTSEGVIKHVDGAMIDLGGIAKGYGIDQAVEAMQAVGCDGGMVEVGGDLRVFGRKPYDTPWVLGIRSPFHPGVVLMGRVHLTEGAVCTSGNYLRFTEIEGQRYSHILDPRTGRPTDANPSVSVIAPAAVLADA